MAALSLNASGVYRPLKGLTRLTTAPFLRQEGPSSTLPRLRQLFSPRIPFTWPNSVTLLPSLLAPLFELFPSIVLAVPKKKVSHSRKSMRSANKGLKEKLNIVCCPACGKPKLSHNLCPNCYSQITRSYKSAARSQAGQLPAPGTTVGTTA